MNSTERTKASKFLSLILRHKPGEINIRLDGGGWASVDELLKNMQCTRYKLTFEQLKYIVDTDDKRRYTFSEDFSKIRASQGHSINIDLGLVAVKPPDILYHGTSVKAVDSIIKYGLNKMSRQYVHLSKDKETAWRVGLRHSGTPAVLAVYANKMANDGYVFYLSDNGVWLTDSVPVKYIQF